MQFSKAKPLHFASNHCVLQYCKVLDMRAAMRPFALATGVGKVNPRDGHHAKGKDIRRERCQDGRKPPLTLALRQKIGVRRQKLKYGRIDDVLGA
jgi:hypothetical protein